VGGGLPRRLRARGWKGEPRSDKAELSAQATVIVAWRASAADH
jgi:hypothetical protein